MSEKEIMSINMINKKTRGVRLSSLILTQRSQINSSKKSTRNSTSTSNTKSTRKSKIIQLNIQLGQQSNNSVKLSHESESEVISLEKIRSELPRD